MVVPGQFEPALKFDRPGFFLRLIRTRLGFFEQKLNPIGRAESGSERGHVFNVVDGVDEKTRDLDKGIVAGDTGHQFEIAVQIA